MVGEEGILQSNHSSNVRKGKRQDRLEDLKALKAWKVAGHVSRQGLASSGQLCTPGETP
jgi:hypothetical protein